MFTVRAVFGLACIEADAAILRLNNVIAETVVIHPLIGPWMDRFQFQCLKLLLESVQCLSRLLQCCKTFLELFFRQLFIEPTICFVPEIGASHAIRAPHAIPQEGAGCAVDAILRIEKIVTPETVQTLVAPFAFPKTDAVNARSGILYPVAVETILIEACAEEHVAVSVVCRIVGVLAVLTRGIRKTDQRCDIEKMFHLCEKRLIGGKLLT